MLCAVQTCAIKKTDFAEQGLHRGQASGQCPDEDSFDLNAAGDGNECALTCLDGYYRAEADGQANVSCTPNNTRTAPTGTTVYHGCERTWYMGLMFTTNGAVSRIVDLLC